MNKKFTIENPMPPLWLIYPNISQYSIGWRMGYGEGYKFDLFDWLETLTEAEKKEYKQMFPHPIFWHHYDEESEDENSEEYAYEIIQFWNKNGEMKYSVDKLIEEGNDIAQDYLFFWKPNPELIDKSCLGQWQTSFFDVDTDSYSCAEQYMMAEKASLFEDQEIKEKIMQSTDPKEMKALGKKIKNFDQTIWDKIKYSIVLNANYYKFSQNKEMRDFLFSTGNKILVEASPLDTIWGIGLSEKNEKANNPKTWRGNNLLGFALMEVRDELRRLYKNYDKVDWQKIKDI